MSRLFYKRKEVIQSLKEEYDYAKQKTQYYVELFNKQDSLYNVFFVIFSIVLGAVYHITSSGSADASQAILSIQNQQLILSILILALAVIYTYFYIIVQANSYYLIIYSEKITVLEKCLNHYIGKKVYMWEADFMSAIQSKRNVWTKGYLNINYLKTALAFLQYVIIHAGLAVMWFTVNNAIVTRTAYVGVVSVASLFIAYNWIKMWFVLPKHYRGELKKMYQKNLGIRL